MQKQDFYFDLPQELIAQYPIAKRSNSRLLVYDRLRNYLGHHKFNDVIDFLNPGDLLVLNNTKVIQARFHGHKPSGGKVEFLVERILSTNSFLSHIKASKAPKAQSLVQVANGWQVIINSKLDDLYQCQSSGDIEHMLNDIGVMPLPPYINRSSEATDLERYQTVYALHKGSVAAPTAGLHFEFSLLNELKAKGVEVAYTTLHIGAGTFRPVRCANIIEHKMHKEQYNISQELAEQVNTTRARGGRVIAVGTTTLRSLEAAAEQGILKPRVGETDIFIYPGFKFQICDGLITNFHLPQSTLVILVAAFIGHLQTMNIYHEAIALSYRFFSYGDASLLLRQ